MSILTRFPFSSGRLADAYETLPAIDSTLPTFSFPQLDSGNLSSDSLRGSASVIALWSSSCPAARDALSAIVAMHLALAGERVRVVLLANDSTVAPLRAMRSDFAALPVALTAGALNEVFSQTRFGLWRRAVGLPSFLVSDRELIVRYRQVGVEQAADARLTEVRRQLALVMRQ